MPGRYAAYLGGARGDGAAAAALYRRALAAAPAHVPVLYGLGRLLEEGDASEEEEAEARLCHSDIIVLK